MARAGGAIGRGAAKPEAAEHEVIEAPAADSGEISTKAKRLAEKVPPPSPNAATNLLIADIALRGGARLLRLMMERNMLKVRHSRRTAKKIVKGRGVVNTVIGAAAARVATTSVPGAILVGGGLVAKTLYERRKGAKAAEEGDRELAERAAKGD